MKARFFFMARMLCMVLIFSLCCLIFLTICYCIPLNAANYKISVDEFEEEGWYSDVLEQRPGYDQNFYSDQPSIQLVYNDRMDYVRAGGHSDRGPLYNALAMEDEEGEHYARYWHGYAGVLRLLLLLFDCKEIKLLSFAFQILLFALVMSRIGNLGGKQLALLFFVQYILLMPLVVSISMVFAFSIDISLAGILVFIHYHDKMKQKGREYLFYCMIGMLTCFFEELVFGMLSWGIICLWVVILYGKEKTAKENVLHVVKSGLCWICGYAGIWVMKWIYATPVLGESIIMDGIINVLQRSSSNEGQIEKLSYGARIIDRFSAITENYSYYRYSVYYALLGAMLLYLTVRFFWGKAERDARIPALGLVFLSPFVWYFVLANHTLGHRIMTYRIFNCGIIALLAILLLSVPDDNIEIMDSSKERRKKGSVAVQTFCVLLCMFLGAICATQKKEEFESKNVQYAGELLSFTEAEGSVAQMRFVPRYGKIKKIGMGIQPAEDLSGSYECRLLQNGSMVYSKEFPASWLTEESWRFIEFNWKVKAGQEYLFEIVPKTEKGQEGYLTVCYPDDLNTADLGELMIGGEAMDCQLTFWMTYEKRIEGKKYIFYAMTWFAMLLGTGLIVYNAYRKRTN